jgi:glycosyltransferase involved in cell wall biosynthesis
MILGIDACNLRAGGGITHLVEFIASGRPFLSGFEQVIIWGSQSTLEKVGEQKWLKKIHEPLLDRGLLFRLFWHCFKLKYLAKNMGCSVIFVPGGLNVSGFSPIVTMSRNMLPFEWNELKRYGFSLISLKFILLRWGQSRSFRYADGVIFLTKYAQDTVLKIVGSIHGKGEIIPHGVNSRFLRIVKSINNYEINNRVVTRILYVSIIDLYKHQWNVVDAVAQLRNEGFLITLDLIGPPSCGVKLLQKAIMRTDPCAKYIKYHGEVAHEKLDTFYADADIGIFASSCENMPNILLEGMASGLPMVCSKKGPMPEILGDAGIYFDPENIYEIKAALKKVLESSDLQKEMSLNSKSKTQNYSWQKCSDSTFKFLSEIAKEYGSKSYF